MICKVIVLVILVCFIYRLAFTEGYYDKGRISKIIHQQGPADIKKWHPDWSKYHRTWIEHFPESEYKHMLWNDDSIRELVKSEYQWLLPYYDGLNKNIMRYDVSRLLMLHKYGGIYADLDMEVHQNFYDKLSPNLPNIVGSNISSDKGVQNSLMASPPGHPFWLEVISDIINNPKLYEKTDALEGIVVIDGTGPGRISKTILRLNQPFRTLNANQYNHPKVFFKNKYATHKYTGVWKSKDNRNYVA